ncbi:hypothetical protein [Prauserella cavernicola]|uniref:Uncharacterized protein n=1 Tax=Prauserella cavernicola TaxID=2800127 RepID=A0A934QVC4_9PSEU|nr:hypothetical protein [Prauserella cavernicola]MBK1785999.1 hypothetical protein [Prauserella cavernicola]
MAGRRVYIWTVGMVQGLIDDAPACADLVTRIVHEEEIIRGRLAPTLGDALADRMPTPAT